jgi:hypothetical protein
MLWAAYRKVNAKREVPRYNPASRVIANGTEPGMSDEKDISKVREEEAQRGRRPKHVPEKERQRRLKKLVWDSMRKGNRALFQQVLIDLDEKPGTSRYDELMKMYDDYQRAKH